MSVQGFSRSFSTKEAKINQKTPWLKKEQLLTFLWA
jgi:hypothetical protein